MTAYDAFAIAAVLWVAAILAVYHTCHGSMTRLGRLPEGEAHERLHDHAED